MGDPHPRRMNDRPRGGRRCLAGERVRLRQSCPPSGSRLIAEPPPPAGLTFPSRDRSARAAPARSCAGCSAGRDACVSLRFMVVSRRRIPRLPFHHHRARPCPRQTPAISSKISAPARPSATPRRAPSRSATSRSTTGCSGRGSRCSRPTPSRTGSATRARRSTTCWCFTSSSARPCRTSRSTRSPISATPTAASSRRSIPATRSMRCPR